MPLSPLNLQHTLSINMARPSRPPSGSSQDDSDAASDSDNGSESGNELENLPAYQRKNRELARQRATAELADGESEEHEGCMTFSSIPRADPLHPELLPDGPSAYNDNRGIKAIVTLVLFLDPKHRTRANQKPSTESCLLYFHEDMALRDWIVKLLRDGLHRQYLLENASIWNGKASDDGNSVSITYTVPRKVKDPLRLRTEDDFDNMLEEAKSLDTSKDGARVLVTVTELLPQATVGHAVTIFHPF